MRRCHSKTCFASAFLALSACTGDVLSAAGPAGQEWAEPGRRPGDPGTETPGSHEPGEDRAVAAPLRRLTRDEYHHTIRDLLGIDEQVSRDFALDELAAGFAANSTAPVDPLQLEHYQRAAETLAAQATQRLEAIAPCAEGEQEDACFERFLSAFGTRAYRRPLTLDELVRYRELFALGKEPDGYAAGVELVISAMLQSPHFLYRLELGEGGASADAAPLTPYELASRLSYALQATMPDEELLRAAREGRLTTAAEVQGQAERLLSGEHASDMFRSFFTQWLEMESLEALEKNEQAYPDFTPELREAMRDELDAFVEAVMRDHDARLDTLLTADFSFVRGPLHALYGLEGPPASHTTPERVTLPPGQRAGIFTLASVMARHGHPDQSAPVKRGYLVLDKLLCTVPPPPPVGLDITVPEVDPGLSTRERFDEHRKDPTCATCHQLMDPLGFTFEHYDGMGGHRSTESGLPVDASALIAGTDVDGPVQDAVALMERLSGSEQVRRCMVQHWFRWAFGRVEDPSDAGDRYALDSTVEAFAAAGHRLDALMAALTGTRAFRERRLAPSQP